MSTIATRWFATVAERPFFWPCEKRDPIRAGSSTSASSERTLVTSSCGMIQLLLPRRLLLIRWDLFLRPHRITRMCRETTIRILLLGIISRLDRLIVISVVVVVVLVMVWWNATAMRTPYCKIEYRKMINFWLGLLINRTKKFHISSQKFLDLVKRVL